jgi:ferredoxin-NADP reductase
VAELVDETPGVKSLVLELDDWGGHRAGQHVDIRLTAEDGYQAERSYSIASAPEDGQLQLTIERLPEGEVSPYLVDVLHAGDELELRGPIGGYFVWEVSYGGPLMLIAGGSGIAPLHAMLRHRAAQDSDVPVRLLYSARTLDDVIYRDEFARLGSYEGVGITYTLTRGAPEGWRGYRRRIDREMLEEVVWPASARPLVYICGPTPFVEAAASSLVQLGHAPERIKTERFGPTGG